MNPRPPILPVAALAAIAGLAVASTQAEAHARLVGASPAANASVATPKAITLHFSERLEPKFSGFDVMKADGGKVAVASSVSAKDRKIIAAAVSGKLAPGAYMVMWRAVSADGHRIKGAFNFTVR